MRQFINNRQKPHKNSKLLKKRLFCPESLNIALSIIDLKGERRVWTFYREKLWFQHMWNNSNDLAKRQKFRADFRMTPNRVGIECFPMNFAKFLRTSFLQNTHWKIDCGKHYHLSKYFIKVPRNSSGTAKPIATFKETTNCRIPRLSVQFGFLELISHNPILF